MAAATTLPNAFVYEGELQRFFRSRESELGIRSNMGAQVNALLSGGGTHASHDFDHAMVDLLDRNKTLGVFRAVWSALTAMERAGHSRLVVVLHLLYGHTRAPDFPAGHFGDVAAIAHLTDAAELAREELAAAESEVSMVRLSVAFDDAALAARRDVIAEEFWREAVRHQTWSNLAAKLRARHVDELSVAARYQEAMKRQNASWRRLGALLDEYDREPKTRALIGACAHADWSWTPRAAIKARLQYDGPRDEYGKPRKLAYEQWQRARDEWTSAVRIEATALRTQALEAYRDARREGR